MIAGNGSDKETQNVKEVVILVAENDAGHLKLIKKCLRRGGLDNEIIELADGQETLDFLFGQADGPGRQKDKKYILLLDIRMPGADGVEVLEKMQQDAGLKDIPVIIVTTSRDDELAERCYSLGCKAHIVKPPDEMLIEAVQQVRQNL